MEFSSKEKLRIRVLPKKEVGSSTPFLLRGLEGSLRSQYLSCPPH